MARRPIKGANETVLPQGALVEFVAQGQYVKVSAVDPVTFVEVSIVGPISAGEALLTQQAVRKLERMVYRYKYAKGARGKRAEAAVPRDRRPEPPSGWDL